MTPAPSGVPAGAQAGSQAGPVLAQGLEWSPAPIDWNRAGIDLQARGARARTGRPAPAKLVAGLDQLRRDMARRDLAATVPVALRERCRAMQHEFRARLAAASARESAAVLEAAQADLDRMTTDRELRLWAAQRARECAELAASCSAGDVDALSLLKAYCEGWLIAPPALIGSRHVEGCIARLCDAKWWRGQTRKTWAQRREARNVRAGLVHAAAGLYVSDELMQWTRQRRQANRDMLETLEALSDAGDVLSLTDAIDASVSNPELRCTELMVRNAGMEFLAECRGDDALFLTWTLASRYHARKWKNRRVWPNPNYCGATPREAQARLAELWDTAVRRLRRAGIQWYGSRFVQPHHDGCPHWHLLVYVAPADREALIAIMRECALLDDPTEPGASRRRFDVKMIDRSKGSAVGYVARYVSRAVNGRGLSSLKDLDDAGRQQRTAAADAVERVTAWASVWRIRLFQFIGTPPITVWRELRRKRDGEAEGFALEVLRAAADAGDFAEWLEAMGGPCCKKKNQTAHTLREPSARLNAYGEQPANQTKGVQLSLEFATDADPAVAAAVAAAVAGRRSDRGRRSAARAARLDALSRPDVAARIAARPRVRTRLRTWTVQRKGATVAACVASTWTRVNNCPDLMTPQRGRPGSRSGPPLEQARRPA